MYVIRKKGYRIKRFLQRKVEDNRNLPYRLVRFKNQISQKLRGDSFDREVVEYLRDIGCDSNRHMNRTLTDHFLGTYYLLSKWKNKRSVCLAGLCHALYGTETFPTALVPPEQRRDVISLIGPEAEELVYLYSINNREHFVKNLNREGVYTIRSYATGEIVSITEQKFSQLTEIFLADRLEQFFEVGPQTRYEYREFFSNAKVFLSRPAYREFLIASKYGL